ncbi:MAG: TetR/AcrR family transcriptional regulator, partial [Bacillota bacterium]
MNLACPVKALKRAYHHGDLRNALVAEALHLLEKSGTSDFTLRDLAKRVGVSYAAPYAHFEDKRALLVAVAAGAADKLTAALLAGTQGKTDPVEEFLGMGQAYVQFGLEHPALYRLMFTAWELTPEDKHKYPELEQASERCFKTLTDMLERQQKSGFLRPGMVEADALTIWSMVHGIAMLAIDGRIECATEHAPP